MYNDLKKEIHEKKELQKHYKYKSFEMGGWFVCVLVRAC